MVLMNDYLTVILENNQMVCPRTFCGHTNMPGHHQLIYAILTLNRRSGA